MDDLGSPDFNPVDWINSNINAESTTSIEDQVNSLLARLQIRSREISQATDQHIRTLVSDVPQSMAKLSQIGSTVNEISDSLRGLTNSGYKFKCGNVPDKITELSTLKIRRDRLKSASEMLKLGIEFESELTTLKAFSASGNLQAVCARYEKVSKAAHALSSIPKFHQLQIQLQDVRKGIEDRLKPELTSACSRKDSASFVTFAQYAGQISAEYLPSSILLARFRGAISEVISGLTDGSLGITQWIKPCFEQCRELIVTFANWSLALEPPLFQPSLRTDFLHITSQLLSQAIEPKARALLTSTDFPSLSQVMTIINGFTAGFPADWSIQPGFFLRGCSDSVQSAFPDVLQSYLSPFLQPPPRSSPKSSSRSPVRASPEPFDNAKLGRLVLTGINCLPWIRVLSRDHSRCIGYVCRFLTGAVELTITERRATKQKPDDKSFEIALAELARYYNSQTEIGRRLAQFEADASTLCGAPLTSPPSAALARLQDVVEGEIVDVMVARPIGLLNGVSAAQDWRAEIDDHEAAVFEGTSRYVALVNAHLIGLMKQLGANGDLANDLVARWMIRAAARVLAACLNEFGKIEGLSIHGRKQLRADIYELQNLFANWIPESRAGLGELVADLDAEIEARTALGLGSLRARIDGVLQTLENLRP